MCLFSVIVPVYNVEQYLTKCIDSILSQTITDFEVILVNDGSKDKSGYICDEYSKKDTRVKVIHKENGGVSSARNKGLEIAKGKYISFVDSDDYVNSDYLEKLYNPEVDIVICGLKQINTNSKNYILRNARYGVFDVNGQVVNEIIESHYINSCYSKMYRRDIIQKNKITFKEDISLGEDMLFSFDYILNSKSLEIKNDAIYNYIKYEKDTLSTLNKDKIHYLEKCEDYIESKLLETYGVTPPFNYYRNKWGKYEWTIFKTIDSRTINFLKKVNILKDIFNNHRYRELLKDIDIYMSNDTQIARDVLSSRNAILILLFFKSIKLKEKILLKLKIFRGGKNATK